MTGVQTCALPIYVCKLLGVNRVRCTKAIKLSAHILRSKSILAMTKRASTEKMWGDNLCFFSYLAVEHEWDETSSSLVFVKENNRRRFPPTTGNVSSALIVAREERGL